jgi:hypothetical protein
MLIYRNTIVYRVVFDPFTLIVIESISRRIPHAARASLALNLVDLKRIFVEENKILSFGASTEKIERRKIRENNQRISALLLLIKIKY